MSHTHKMVEFVACALCAMVAVSGAQAGLTLTPTGIADGFSLSVFATGFPHNTNVCGFAGCGPFGIATNSDGNIMVSSERDVPAAIKVFKDIDGQSDSFLCLLKSSQ
jgi:hypothetical protein